MKVKKPFFCTQESKDYALGQEYTGSRTDLGAYLEKDGAPATENKNAAPKTATKKPAPKK